MTRKPMCFIFRKSETPISLFFCAGEHPFWKHPNAKILKNKIPSYAKLSEHPDSLIYKVKWQF